MDEMRPVAVVTGAARRVGRAIALELAGAGLDLVLTCHAHPEQARSTAEACEARSARVRLERTDFDRPEEVETLGATLAAECPRIDVLVHNAALYGPTPLPEATADEALRFFRINALAPLVLSRALAAKLADSPLPGGGAIVAMADIHALGRPRTGFAPYAMSKAALAEMVRSLARELAPRVRVNAVAPGVVAWPESGYEADAEAQRAYIRRVPLGRAGTPEDAARAVRWLALDATYITGQIIRLDGGRSLA